MHFNSNYVEKQMFTDQAYEVLAQVPGGAHGIKNIELWKTKIKNVE